ncbi:MAG: phage integrase SAM-like domain-containing protein, partial [Candidatus Cloacimonetes bacterium]|nr:phage integrase SAM-like domain-containing protein [Candidatus Cloacimonadota bacterium]
MDYLKDVLSKIINDNSKIKINYKKDENGGVFLYLNYRKMINGISKQQTKRIGITIQGTKESRKDDLNKIKMAMEYREEFERKADTGSGIFKNDAERIFISDYLEVLHNQYRKNNSAKIFRSLKTHIKNFKGDLITLAMIDKKFCIDFANYMSTVCENSAFYYVGKFKQVLYKAIEDELIPDMPFLRSYSIKQKLAKREFLTIDELNLIQEYDYKNIEYKNAFIFTCFTGLRFVDIFNLKFSSVVNGYLELLQEKTQEQLKIKLHKEALNIIEYQKSINKKKSDKVFNLASYEIWRRNVARLCKEAGITKKITGHCG